MNELPFFVIAQLKAILYGLIYGIIAKLSKKLFIYFPLSILIIIILLNEDILSFIFDMPDFVSHFFLKMGFVAFFIAVFISYKTNYLVLLDRIKITIKRMYWNLLAVYDQSRSADTPSHNDQQEKSEYAKISK